MKDKDDYDEYGWIAPDGQFYKCGCYEHRLYAETILKTTEWQLEQSGWIKISSDCINGRGIYGDLKNPYPCMTMDQRYTCIRLGFTDEDIKDFNFLIIE